MTSKEARPDRLTSAQIRMSISEYQAIRAHALADIETLATKRRELLLSGSDRQIADHDATVARARREMERADAQLDLRRAELTLAVEREERQRQDAIDAELTEAADRYRHLVESRYPQVAAPLTALLVELQNLAAKIEAMNQILPAGLRGNPDEFRKDASCQWFGPLFETVILPPILQDGASFWPEARVPVRRSVPPERGIAQTFVAPPEGEHVLNAPNPYQETVDFFKWEIERNQRPATERAGS